MVSAGARQQFALATQTAANTARCKKQRTAPFLSRAFMRVNPMSRRVGERHHLEACMTLLRPEREDARHRLPPRATQASASAFAAAFGGAFGGLLRDRPPPNRTAALSDF